MSGGMEDFNARRKFERREVYELAEEFEQLMVEYLVRRFGIHEMAVKLAEKVVEVKDNKQKEEER